MANAVKVAEIFDHASLAFGKLAQLVLELKQVQAQSNDSEVKPSCKWSNKELDLLKSAIMKFGNDLTKIAEMIETKTFNQIKAKMRNKAFLEAGLGEPPAIAKGPTSKDDSNTTVQSLDKGRRKQKLGELPDETHIKRSRQQLSDEDPGLHGEVSDFMSHRSPMESLETGVDEEFGRSSADGDREGEGEEEEDDDYVEESDVQTKRPAQQQMSTVDLHSPGSNRHELGGHMRGMGAAAGNSAAAGNNAAATASLSSGAIRQPSLSVSAALAAAMQHRQAQQQQRQVTNQAQHQRALASGGAGSNAGAGVVEQTGRSKYEDYPEESEEEPYAEEEEDEEEEEEDLRRNYRDEMRHIVGDNNQVGARHPDQPGNGSNY